MACTYLDGSTPRVCIVGAGLAGICAAINLKRQLGHTNFVIFDKGDDFGGVWLVNTYPGCQVDIPAFLYSFSFAQNPNWSKICPDRDEMWTYIKYTAAKFDIYRNAQFGTAVEALHWDEDTKTWTVTTMDVRTQAETVHEFNVVILGTGPLSTPNFPREFETFSGPKMHSSQWNSSIALENQVVGVVGTGSSAVQIIPNIAPKVKKLIVYMREPNYVLPKAQIHLAPISRRVLSVFPCILRALRALVFLVLDQGMGGFKVGSFRNKAGRFAVIFQIRRCVKDKDLRKQLTPRYEVGYKIPAIAYKSYYGTYNRPNVELNRSRVANIEGQNVTTEDGKVDRLDVLILCTGFKFMDLSSVLIAGVGGVDLLRLWKTGRPETFYGVTCAEAPNLFFLGGPNGGNGRGSVLFMIECQVTFAINALRELMKRDAAAIRVRASAQSQSLRKIREGEQKRAYTQAGPPGVSPTWLLNENGHSVVWPKSSISYWLRTRRLDAAKFEFSGRAETAGRRSLSRNVGLLRRIYKLIGLTI